MILDWLFSHRNLVRLKLVLWTGVAVWMLLFTVLGAVHTYNFIKYDYARFFGASLWDKFIAYITPAWIMFTAVLVDIYVAAFVSRNLRRKDDSNE